MSTKRKRSVLSIKDKQIIISRLDKGEKGTNLAPEFGISKQQISDIRKNNDKILKFTENIETSEGLKRKSLSPDNRGSTVLNIKGPLQSLMLYKQTGYLSFDFVMRAV